MIHEANNKVKSTRGFTMTEMLAVVAILVIVAAISVGGWVDMQKNIQMNRLDSEAQQIYQAAQSRLSDLQSAGKTPAISSDFSAHRTQVSAMPQDYPGSNWSEVELYYVTKGDSQSTDYLISPASTLISSQLLDGTYIIEVSPSTAEIYGVFYVEPGSSLTYSDIQGLSGRDRKSREDKRIGYYGGKGELSVAVTDVPTELKNIQCDFVNGNDLYVRLWGANFSTLVANPSDVKVTLTLKGKDTSGVDISMSQDIDGTALKNAAAANNNQEVDFVIDSLDPESNFKKLCAKNNVDFAPGCNLTSTIEIEYKGKKYNASNTKLADITQNSLFGSLDTTTGTVTVSNLRHLNNLRQDILGAPITGVNAVSTVKVGADIDFTAANWDQSDPTAENPNKPARVALQNRNTDGTAKANLLTEFLPLSGNNAFEPGDTFDGGYLDGNGDAQNHQLLNFKIGNTTATSIANVGLFQNLSGSVSNLVIRDAVVSATNGNAGAVAGTISGAASATNVKVVNTTVAGPGDNIGGFAGSMSGGTLSGCGVYKEYGASSGAVSGAKNIGGFIGWQQSDAAIDVSNCYAALPVEGEASVGGFVGWSKAQSGTGKTLKMNHCYASGSVTATASHYDGSNTAAATTLSNGEGAGGFVGTLPQSSGNFAIINNCFATGNVSGPECIGGFAGYLFSAWIGQSNISSEAGGCQSFGVVTSTDELNWTDGGFVGAKRSTNPARNADCYYLQLSNMNQGFDENAKATSSDGNWTIRDYNDCVAGTVLPADRTHVFSAQLNGESFPFQDASWFNGADGVADTADDLDFYGDWNTCIVANLYDNDSGSLAASVLALPLWQGGVNILFPTPAVPSQDPGPGNLWHWNGPIPIIEDGSDTDVAYYENMTFGVESREVAEATTLSSANTALTSWIVEGSESDASGRSSTTGTIDSEAVGSNIRGTATQFNNYLRSCGFDPSEFSWCLDYKQGTMLSPGNQQGEPVSGSGDSAKGGLIMYLGEKATAVGQTVTVTCYDVGRANSGMASVREGTMKVKARGSYLIYDPKSFTPTTAWR